MIGSLQHEIAKWLSEILEPALKRFSTHCVKDSFTFASFIQNLKLGLSKTFLCLLVISSLFNNVPLDETTGICADALILIAHRSLRTLSKNLCTNKLTQSQLEAL